MLNANCHVLYKPFFVDIWDVCGLVEDIQGLYGKIWEQTVEIP